MSKNQNESSTIRISDYIRILHRALNELGDVPMIVRIKDYNPPVTMMDASYPNESLTYFTDKYAVLDLIRLTKGKNQ